MAQDALTAIALRNNFYKDSQRRVIFALFLSGLMNIILIIMAIYLYQYEPEPRYFSTSINGRITNIVPLSEPNQLDSSVLQWANQATMAAFTYNFVNYRDELRAASGFFTPEGWQKFIKALDNSNTLAAVKAHKWVGSAVPTGAPTILKKELSQGVYTWSVQIPVLVTYQNSNEYTQENVTVNLIIKRISSLNSPRGIGIEQFVVTPAVGGPRQ